MVSALSHTGGGGGGGGGATLATKCHGEGGGGWVGNNSWLYNGLSHRGGGGGIIPGSIMAYHILCEHSANYLLARPACPGKVWLD